MSDPVSTSSQSIARAEPVTRPDAKIVSPPSFLGNGLRQKFVNALILLLLLALPLAAHLQGADFLGGLRHAARHSCHRGGYA